MLSPSLLHLTFKTDGSVNNISVIRLKPEELKKKLDAVFVVTLTPFKEDGEVDLEGVRRNTRFFVNKYSNEPLVLSPTGSIGEFYTLSSEERKAVIKTVVEEAKGKIPVVAGTAHSGTIEALRMSKFAEEAGCDGVIAVLPYYHVPCEEGMYQHYKTIAEGVNIGVMVYNNPDTSKCYIKPPLMARIAEIPGIAGVKENTKNLATFSYMMELVGDKVPVLCGLGEFWFSFEYLLGCRGFVTGIANFAPDISLSLLKAAHREDHKEVREIIKTLQPLLKFRRKVSAAYGPTTTILPSGFTTSYEWLGVLKEATNMVGLCGGVPRLPILPLKSELKEELRNILADMDLPVK